MMPHQHFCALVDEMTDNVDRQSTAPKGRRILNLLRDRIHGLLAPPLTAEEQRVTNDAQRVIADHLQAEEQRVIDDSPNMTVPRITDAPTIMNSRNPTAKRMLKITPRVHDRVDGIEHNCNGANESDRKNNGKMCPTARLSSSPF